ncbi:hypothetical protein V6Z11_1Z107900 [Gossypium hirsutum]
MKIVSWNIRGMGTDLKITLVNRLLSKYRVDMCFLRESKLEVVTGDLISRIWGDDNFDFRYAAALGRSGGLITIWDKSVFLLKSEYCGNRYILLERKWLLEEWEGV